MIRKFKKKGKLNACGILCGGISKNFAGQKNYKVNILL